MSLVMVALPSLGMLWARTDSTTENRQLAAAPGIFDEDGSFNVDVLADAGAYFDDHFAYRNQLVTANAHLRAALGASPTDQVIVGGDDWLYYGGTLNDYLGRSALTDRGLANIAHNLRLAQGYVTSKGAVFAFTVAPNKNTLYDDAMPSYYVRNPQASNAERLKPLLEKAGINYVDLFGLMESQDQTRYLLRDTHWDNRGALLAADALLQACGKQPLPVDPESGQVRDDFIGDLQSMLYPGEERTEPNYYYVGYNDAAESDAIPLWEFTEGGDVTESWLLAKGRGEGSLLMFRDSFGNALLPFMAAAYEISAFSKLVPYNLPALTQVNADAVIIERAERHLSDLATAPPIMPNPTVSFKGGKPADMAEVPAMLECASEGSYWVVRGSVDQALDAGSRLYLGVQLQGADEVLYDPFWLSFANDADEVQADDGLLAYIPASSMDVGSATLHLYVK